MKKIMMMLIAMSMSLSLMACGNNAETGSKENAVESNSAVTEEPVDEVPEEPDDKETASENTTESEESSEESTQTTGLTVDADYANLSESEGFEFESNGDGTCVLTKIGTCSDADIVIPEKSPDGDVITEIAEYAFYDAKDVNSIVFAGKTMELDNKAFASCGVKKIVITGCELVVGESAFSYCEDINEVSINNSNLEIDSYAFYDSGKDMSVKIAGCTGILNEKAFQSCGITDLTISDSKLVTSDSAFAYCEDMTTALFENSTVEIGSYVFYESGDDAAVTFIDCELDIDDKGFQSSAIVTLSISGGETVMGDNAFSYCEDLTDVTIGSNNIEIGKYSFYDCTALVNVFLVADSEDDSMKVVIEDNAFQTCSVQNVVIGRGDIEIGDNAFSYCEDLVSVEIMGTLSDIGDYVFYDCPAELAISYNGATYNKESIEDAK